MNEFASNGIHYEAEGFQGSGPQQGTGTVRSENNVNGQFFVGQAHFGYAER